MAALSPPPNPGLVCPEPECGERLVVIESGWVGPPSLEKLEPDVATYTLECPCQHGRFQYTERRLTAPGGRMTGRSMDTPLSPPRSTPQLPSEPLGLLSAQ